MSALIAWAALIIQNGQFSGPLYPIRVVHAFIVYRGLDV